jgi:hypothetical protein
MTSYGFRRGQHVTAVIEGTEVDGVFVRQAEQQDRIDLEAVPGGDISAVGWVRRLDTGEIEAFAYADITPKPEADVRIAIGKAYKARQDERGTARAFAEELRATLGVSIDLEITDCQPGRRRVGPIELTAIFIATTVATSLIDNITNDLYAKAKQVLLDRRARAESQTRDLGFRDPPARNYPARRQIRAIKRRARSPRGTTDPPSAVAVDTATKLRNPT